jgi:diguanylate cyclase (GGDEF)-like protein
VEARVQTPEIERRPHRVTHLTVILILVGCLAGATVVLTARAVMAPIGAHAAELAHRILPADRALQATSSAARDGQTQYINALSATDPAARGAAIQNAQDLGRLQDASWATYLRYAGHSADERGLQKAAKSTFDTSRALAGTVIGLNPTDPAYAPTLAKERASSDLGRSLVAQIQTRFYDPLTEHASEGAVTEVANGKLAILIATAVAFLLFLGTGAVLYRRARRSERAALEDARVRAIETRRSDVETRLQRALEMEGHEDGTYAVIRDALRTVAGDRSVELLAADSPQAHFRQVLSTVDPGVDACRVAAPGECPAARTGQTRIWEDSELLDTCPYLRNYPDRVWAGCVPVSIAGQTTGVLHAQGPVAAPPTDELTDELELVARKAGDRIGVLRVLARTEERAEVDPLTGLPNRRALEDRTRGLLDQDAPFVVAYADLDHFKNLNDTYGHDTGDRALRLFARVLRDSIRPRDIPARYGGEEFVVVLPDCSPADAQVVAERVRAQLATALGAGNLPPFTVSVGLAPAAAGQALSEVIEHADAALSTAKQSGRDRVVVADTTPDQPPVGRAAVLRDPLSHN